jgi:hypothetical protein
LLQIKRPSEAIAWCCSFSIVLVSWNVRLYSSRY